jgi:hypothetical protein
MRLVSRCHRLHPLALLPVSAMLIAVSVQLLSAHAEAVSAMRRTGLPAAVGLRQIETRAAIVREQNEVAGLQASLRSGTEQEILRISVLPDAPAPDRLLATFDVVFSQMHSAALLPEFPVITVGEPVEHSGEAGKWVVHPLSFSLTATEEGMQDLFTFLQMAGMLTISDLLSPAEIHRLLTLTEQHNPAAITALEQFLSVDVLRFAETPRPYQDQLFGSLSSPLFAEELTAMLDVPARRNGLAQLRKLAPVLRARNLWPVRFLSIAHVRMEQTDAPWWTADLTVEAASRMSSLR